MSVHHIVVFKFKSTSLSAQHAYVLQEFRKLKTQCVSPSTHQPYIKAMTGGRNISHEGLDNGHTHLMHLEFNSLEDRDYYVNEDPAHQAFKKEAAERVESVLVFDYMNDRWDKQ